MLSTDDFKFVVQSVPLLSIDLVLLNEHKQILVGKRKNAPAKGYWFVPGGRVFKNELLVDAFLRICLSELNEVCDYKIANPLGLYDHLYSDSVFGVGVSTHYINAPYLIILSENTILDPPSDQHQEYRWVSIYELDQDESVHQYSKVFLDSLFSVLRENGSNKTSHPCCEGESVR